MQSFRLKAIPGELNWLNQPVAAQVKSENSLSITAGAEQDWFHSPADRNFKKRSAPVALFSPPDASLLLSARVTVGFNATYDAGVLFVFADEQHWAKLCFEYSPQGEPMVVSVVTRDQSDDCNSVIIPSNTVYSRIYRHDETFAFHYSTDGQRWHFVRHFTLGRLSDLRLGFCAQAPTGKGCTVDFDKITYQATTLANLRSGE
ncbi:MAG TPA: DUF1349 domain-containing protein [Anaerolineaceae bacterium]